MPIDASPASYSPGVSLARGSFASDPVIPAGSVGAGSGANGFLSSSSSSLSACCAGGGVAGVCARTRLTPEHKRIAATAIRKAKLGTRFIASPLMFLLQHSLHNPDLGRLRILRIRREVEQLSILPSTRGVEQILYHRQRTIVVLNHPCQE